MGTSQSRSQPKSWSKPIYDGQYNLHYYQMTHFIPIFGHPSDVLSFVRQSDITTTDNAIFHTSLITPMIQPISPTVSNQEFFDRFGVYDRNQQITNTKPFYMDSGCGKITRNKDGPPYNCVTTGQGYWRPKMRFDPCMQAESDSLLDHTSQPTVCRLVDVNLHENPGSVLGLSQPGKQWKIKNHGTDPVQPLTVQYLRFSSPHSTILSDGSGRPLDCSAFAAHNFLTPSKEGAILSSLFVQHGIFPSQWNQSIENFTSRISIRGIGPNSPVLPLVFPKTSSKTNKDTIPYFTYPKPVLSQVSPCFEYDFRFMIDLLPERSLPTPHHLCTILILQLDCDANLILNNFIKQTNDYLSKGCIYNLTNVPIYIIILGGQHLDAATLSQSDIIDQLTKLGFSLNNISIHNFTLFPEFRRQTELDCLSMMDLFGGAEHNLAQERAPLLDREQSDAITDLISKRLMAQHFKLYQNGLITDPHINHKRCIDNLSSLKPFTQPEFHFIAGTPATIFDPQNQVSNSGRNQTPCNPPENAPLSVSMTLPSQLTEFFTQIKVDPVCRKRDDVALDLDSCQYNDFDPVYKSSYTLAYALQMYFDSIKFAYQIGSHPYYCISPLQSMLTDSPPSSPAPSPSNPRLTSLYNLFSAFTQQFFPDIDSNSGDSTPGLTITNLDSATTTTNPFLLHNSIHSSYPYKVPIILNPQQPSFNFKLMIGADLQRLQQTSLYKHTHPLQIYPLSPKQTTRSTSYPHQHLEHNPGSSTALIGFFQPAPNFPNTATTLAPESTSASLLPNTGLSHPFSQVHFQFQSFINLCIEPLISSPLPFNSNIPIISPSHASITSSQPSSQPSAPDNGTQSQLSLLDYFSATACKPSALWYQSELDLQTQPTTESDGSTQPLHKIQTDLISHSITSQGDVIDAIPQLLCLHQNGELEQLTKSCLLVTFQHPLPDILADGFRTDGDLAAPFANIPLETSHVGHLVDHMPSTTNPAVYSPNSNRQHATISITHDIFQDFSNQVAQAGHGFASKPSPSYLTPVIPLEYLHYTMIIPFVYHTGHENPNLATPPPIPSLLIHYCRKPKKSFEPIQIGDMMTTQSILIGEDSRASLIHNIVDMGCPVTFLIACANPVVKDTQWEEELAQVRNQNRNRHELPEETTDADGGQQSAYKLEPIPQSHFQYFATNIPMLYKYQLIYETFFPERWVNFQKLEHLWDVQFVQQDDLGQVYNQCQKNAIDKRLEMLWKSQQP